MNNQGSASMLDDINVIKQRDPSGALGAVMALPEQASFQPEVIGSPVDSEIKNIVFAGMGGSALAADMVKVLLSGHVSVPIEVIKGYDLPGYADESTLVVAISHSGNTEETLNCYYQAKDRSCVVGAMATGGKLLEQASQDGVVYATVPAGAQPRMSTVYHLRTLLKILQHFNIVDGSLFDEISQASGWLAEKLSEWTAEVPLEHNYAKQLASQAVGKTAVFYGGQLTWPIAYKWKISWNETAKNVAFWNQYPEFSHNEFMGWRSHPIEKPYAVFDLKSHFERPRIAERMELTDRMLSGMRPKAVSIQLIGDGLVRQFLWALALADMSSIYGAILNNIDPAPVDLIEKFKAALS